MTRRCMVDEVVIVGTFGLNFSSVAYWVCLKTSL